MVLILLGESYCRCWLARPVGEGPAGPPVSREAFNSPWTDRKVLVLGVGDSVTAGFGVDAPYGYVARLVGNPLDEFSDMQGLCLSKVLPDLHVENIAVSGSTSLRHLELLEQLEKRPPDTFGLVLITTGGNDLIHWYGRSEPREGAMYGGTLDQALPWIENFRARLDRIVDRLEAAFPGGCLIFLGDIYDPTDGVGDAVSAWLPHWPDGLEIHRRYNQAIRQLAAKRKSVRVVLIHAAFLGHGTHCRQFWREHYRSEDPFYWYGANLEDPYQRGYDAIRRVFLIEIAKDAAQIAGRL